mmetsp:Transcript_1721/g.4567  ORF Transcript_1721/g.4567 Transcript_1721/m.4567 type:complete len:83 (-) Transcript_1721:111-359(-)
MRRVQIEMDVMQARQTPLLRRRYRRIGRRMRGDAAYRASFSIRSPAPGAITAHRVTFNTAPAASMAHERMKYAPEVLFFFSA